jgi:hypothetical protein
VRAPVGEQRRVECVDASAAPFEPEGRWLPHANGSGFWWQVAGRARGVADFELARSELALELVGEAEAKTAIARDVVGEAWRDLEQRLTASLGGGGASANEPPLRALRSRWSGAVILAIPWWSAEIRILLAGECVERVLFPAGRAAPRKPARGGLIPLSKAIASRPIRLEARLHRFELEIGALASLRPGDVLRTTHPLDGPLDVEVSGENRQSAVRWSGFLGHAATKRALDLVAERGGTK